MTTAQPLSPASGDLLRTLLRNYSYPALHLICILVLWWGAVGPYDIEIVAIGLQVSMIAIVLGLEFAIPFQERWGTVKNLTRADFIYFMLAAPIDKFQSVILVGVLAATAQYHHYLEVVDIWPNDLPILLQLLIAFMVVDFFKYWYHRWTHEVPILWRFHSIHHCLDRLEMLRASYFYPFDILLTVALGTLAMLMVGAGFELIIFHNVYAGITGLFNHSNADFRCGVFDSFLNSPGHHRAHHSVEEPGCVSNYGSFFNFTDRMFGTRFLPEDQQSFDPLGLSDEYDMPTTVLKQLAVPFQWDRIRRSG